MTNRPHNLDLAISMWVDEASKGLEDGFFDEFDEEQIREQFLGIRRYLSRISRRKATQ